ncbi:MAG TPA: HAD hydrolase-like protein [Candidatus Sumerlaeota bacterium]|nr:HAD hydrolase-like protein [Candidatus Sumerlaeota bacterium]HPS01775.1 HAD hydrolase-like protein [Candidatus Sumerlaeota bacterium]
MPPYRWQAILFDLDGTITDSAPGILNSARHAIAKMELDESRTGDLRRFIGPPLEYSFRTTFGLNESDAWRAVECYREYYAERGIWENTLYPGIRELLENLSQQSGCWVALATAKPEPFVDRILDHFGLAGFFNTVVGSYLDGRRTDKGEIIAEALTRLPAGISRDRVCMVGDRRHDIAGAHTHGLTAIGVTYGYGSREELQEAGADRVVESVQELARLLGLPEKTE